MEVQYRVCCGLDVHRDTVVACLLRTDGPLAERQQTRTFAATTAGLVALGEWLPAAACGDVALEATGVFWKPVFNVLENVPHVVVANAAQIKGMPGRKADVQDAQWIAELFQPGTRVRVLIRPSFIPERFQRELRDLTRTRTTLTDERSAVVNRLHKVLQDANLKLSSVVTDVLGVSGRAMLAAIVSGATDPAALADLAKGRLRNKEAALKDALTGKVTAHHFQKGKADPAFRTKLQLAVELAQRAKVSGLPFRAVVADAFYGKEYTVQQGLEQLGVGYVLALPPSHGWWHREGQVGGLRQAAEAAGWQDAEHPGQWTKLERRFRDGHSETWWALEVAAGPYGPAKAQRAVVATTDPETLPERTTWYVVTNLPKPETERAQANPLAPADLAEIVRLFGLRIWVEQSDKQVKYALGWGEYQVRSDRAIRRHWALVWCAFSFCWLHQRDNATPSIDPAQPVEPAPEASAAPAGRRGGKISASTSSPPLRSHVSWPVALRTVRAWLEPWRMLWRYWRAWSPLPPPPPLQQLLDQLCQGDGINLYATP